tara:strand:- start:74 stop:481 length:408 start_codon:yes stop_codon:yes gene_type:complete
MKKILLIVALFFTFHLSNAQGNLQFNTTVYKTLGPVSMPWQAELIEMGTFIVPENKLWKVSIRGAVISAYSHNGINAIFIKKDNDTNLALANYSSWYENSTLGTGTYTVLASPNNASGSKGYISIIGTEFNIITE